MKTKLRKILDQKSIKHIELAVFTGIGAETVKALLYYGYHDNPRIKKLRRK